MIIHVIHVNGIRLKSPRILTTIISQAIYIKHIVSKILCLDNLGNLFPAKTHEYDADDEEDTSLALPSSFIFPFRFFDVVLSHIHCITGLA